MVTGTALPRPVRTIRARVPKRHNRNVTDIAPSPLVLEIARVLRTDGEFVMHLAAGEYGRRHLQAVVDVGWAARQAGRLLERQVRVATRQSEQHGGLVVTAFVTDV